MSKERDQIWQSIEGSEALHKIYGYYPTFHDANIVNLDVRFEPKEIILTIEYSDLVENSVPSVEYNDGSVRIVMCWRGVVESKFCLYDNDINHFEFRTLDENIETTFTHSSGAENFILAKSVHLISVSLSMCASLPDINEYLHTVNFTCAN